MAIHAQVVDILQSEELNDHGLKCQTFAGSNYSNVRLCCFSLFYVVINSHLLAFCLDFLLVKTCNLKKWHRCSWKMRLTLVTTFFFMFYSNNKQTNNETVSCGFTLQKSTNHFHFFFLFNLHCLGSLEDCVYCKLRCVIIAENPTQLIDLLFTKMCVTRKRWALMIQSNYSIST